MNIHQRQPKQQSRIQINPLDPEIHGRSAAAKRRLSNGPIQRHQEVLHSGKEGGGGGGGEGGGGEGYQRPLIIRVSRAIDIRAAAVSLAANPDRGYTPGRS